VTYLTQKKAFLKAVCGVFTKNKQKVIEGEEFREIVEW